jgi:acyl carrier protein
MPQPANGSTEEQADDDRAAWWDTVRELHRLAAATQASYQRTTAESHLAYLAAVGRSLNHEDGPLPADRDFPANGSAPNGLPAAAKAAALPMEPPPGLADDFPAVEDFGFGEAAPVVDEPQPAKRTEPAPQPDAPAGDGPASARLIGLTLQVVADKTGYPVDILNPEMHLQADLGVDSIKRVEVLSALRDRIEGLPTLDPAEVGRLQTIGEIAERLTAEVGG